MKNIVIILVTGIIFCSCQKRSEIKVTNKVGNCRLESIGFGDYKVSGGLIYGESATVEVKAKKGDFPKKHPVLFYMVSNGNRVFLRTKEEFTLEKEQNLDIVIENSTPVQTP